MHLLCCLVFVEARLGFTIAPRYINMRVNALVNDLSRDNLHSFFLKVPQTNRSPTPILSQLFNLLLDHQQTGPL